MELSKEQKMMQMCQQTKDFVSKHIKDYVDFVLNTLDDVEFVKSATALLPFDNFTDARLRFVGENTPVKSIGLTLMKMELETEKYSFGISIDFNNVDNDGKSERITFISAGHTLDGLKEFVRSDTFMTEVRLSFEEVIEGYYFHKSKLEV